MAYNTRPTTSYGAGFARPNASPSTTTLRVPNAYDDQRTYPLIVALHSYGATGTDLATRLKLDESGAFSDGCFLLAPEGQVSVASNPNQFWNFWDTSGTTNDFLYLKSLVDDVIADWPIDPDQVFVVGYSNGGFMAIQLANEQPALFNAGASLCAPCGVNDASVEIALPIPWVFYYGTSDTTVLPAGDPAGGLPGVLNGHGGVGSVGYSSAVDSAANRAAKNGAGALGAAYATINFVTTPAGDETSCAAFAGTTSATAAEQWSGALATHTITLADHMGQFLIQWMRDHHNVAAATSIGHGFRAKRFAAQGFAAQGFRAKRFFRPTA